MTIDERVGSNIKKYRIANNMTLKDLGDKINKSISTVSKYETGSISLDMTTLNEIASIFHLSPSMLLSTYDHENMISTQYSNEVQKIYMYTYDGSKKCIVESVIERYESLTESGQFEVTLFNGVENVKDPGNCDGLYTGRSKKTGFIETYILHNQIAELEYVMISCVDNLINPKHQLGLVSGLSNYTMLPVSFKAILSDTEITNKEQLIKELQFSKEDINKLRRNQCLSILNIG